MVRAGRKRTVLIGVLALAIGIVMPATLYMAARHVPAFYSRALAPSDAELRRASDELLRRASELTNSARREGRWSVAFTDRQINGWLAVDMTENHPDLLPERITEPRVTIDGGQVLIACRYHSGRISTIFSMEADVYLTEPNVLALRIRRARAGALPLPLGRILERVAAVANDLDLRLSWRQVGGDPVALVELSGLRDDDDGLLILESLELRDGSLLVAGRSEDRAGEQTTSSDASAAATQDSPRENVQR